MTSEVGRSLSTRATRQIAMLAHLENALFPHLMAPLHDELAAHNYRMVLLAERGDDMAVYEQLLNRSIDGVVLTTTRLRSSLPYELERRGLPYVLLNRLSDIVDADTATADNRGGGAAVAQLFLDLGHRRVAAAMGPPDTSTSRDREQGFREVIEEAGLPLRADRVHHAGFRTQDGEAAFHVLMRGRHKPTAVFAVNDMVAVGFINAAMVAGLRVPEDVAVVGFDDLDLAGWPPYRLTTVHSPLPDMARSAGRLLIERIAGGQDAPRRHEVQATRLVLRGTHGA